MQLLFSDSSQIGAYVIRAATRSRFAHVDFVVGPDILFGAMAFSGVSYHTMESRVSKATNAVLMDIPLTEQQDTELRNWLWSQNGKPYDWAAALTVFSLNSREWSSSEKWMCSELVAAGFEMIGSPILDARVISRVAPEDIYRLPFKKTILKGKL